MISVNTIYQQCLTISNKYIGAGFFSADTFNNLAAMVNLQIFNNGFRKFQETQKVTDDIKAFIKNSLIMVDGTSHIASFPSDYMYLASLRAYYNKGDYFPFCDDGVSPDFSKLVQVKCKLIDNGKLADRLSSEVYQPTDQYPIAVEYGLGWRVYPDSIGMLSIDYLRAPSTPFWAFTIGGNGLPTYDAANSTNFEWSPVVSNELVYLIVSAFGIQISSEELTKVTAGFSMAS